MANELNLKAVASKAQSALDKLLRLEKEVKALKDILNTHNNWHAETREWEGKRVVICDRSGTQTTGIFRWADRYNLCITPDNNHPNRIYTKGGINWIARD